MRAGRVAGERIQLRSRRPRACASGHELIEAPGRASRSRRWRRRRVAGPTHGGEVATGMLGNEALLAAFSQLGLTPTCAIMGHASLSALGVVDGGAATVVEALRQAAGPEGAVILPSFRDAIREETYGMRGCRAACPAELCPSREQGYTGII